MPSCFEYALRSRRRRTGRRRALPFLFVSWLKHHLDALVFFVLEDVVGVGCFIKRHFVRDDKRGIDVATLHAFEQRPHVFLYMGLPHFEGETLCKGDAYWKLVNQTTVYTWNGNRPALA